MNLLFVAIVRTAAKNYVGNQLGRLWSVDYLA